MVENWQGIDAIAAGLLHLGRADGVVPALKVATIVEYFRSKAWTGRYTWREAPTWKQVNQLLEVIQQRDPG